LDYTLLDLAQGIVLVMGGTVVFYAARAFTRTRGTSMLLLAAGFAFVTAGSVIAGVLFNLANADLATVETVQAWSLAAGFTILVYSLAKSKD
jgi:hypothetical protein